MTTLKLEAQQAEGGGGGGDVTKEYVDQHDAATLDSANGYTDLVASGKQNTLTAGANITIANDVISATGGTTTVAWGGITGDLSNQTDLDTALGTKQDILTAGTGITIDQDNVISATGISSVDWGDIGGTLSDQTDLDTALSDKQDVLTAGANISIDANNEISAMDTTYSDFVGTDGITDGDNGLVPAPITSDVDKYLKSDGTWATVQSGGSNITMTNVDPGEGQPLAADQYLAYYTAGAAREVEKKDDTSITLDAGKWIIIHMINVNQTSVSSAGIYIYNLGNADSANRTWAVPPASGQNFFAVLTRVNVVEFNSQTTCTLTAGTASNVTTGGSRWIAIPID